MVPDSACTATAMFSGVKVNQDTVGVDATVQHRDCEASLQAETRLQSLAALALDANKSAGDYFNEVELIGEGIHNSNNLVQGLSTVGNIPRSI